MVLSVGARLLARLFRMSEPTNCSAIRPERGAQTRFLRSPVRQFHVTASCNRVSHVNKSEHDVHSVVTTLPYNFTNSHSVTSIQGAVMATVAASPSSAPPA